MDHQLYVLAAYAFTALVMTAAALQVWITAISRRNEVRILADKRQVVRKGTGMNAERGA